MPQHQNIVSIFGEPLDHPERNVRPIPPVDLYEQLAEQPLARRGFAGSLRLLVRQRAGLRLCPRFLFRLHVHHRGRAADRLLPNDIPISGV
jgi:hypothetical protein